MLIKFKWKGKEYTRRVVPEQNNTFMMCSRAKFYHFHKRHNDFTRNGWRILPGSEKLEDEFFTLITEAIDKEMGWPKEVAPQFKPSG